LRRGMMNAKHFLKLIAQGNKQQLYRRFKLKQKGI